MLVRIVSYKLNLAEEAIYLIIDPGGEEEFVLFARQMTIAKGQCPQAINGDGMTILIFQLTVKFT